MTSRCSLVAVLLAGALLAPRVALAGDVALAETLFREGRDLMEHGDYARACPKLSESFNQDASTGTLLALALCQEQIGQTASAWASFTGVVTRAKRDGRPDRERAALQHLQALEPQLSRLTIEVDPTTASIPGVVVTRDGIVLGQGAWGASAPIDPGPHVIEATAPGKSPFKATIAIGSRADTQLLRVPALGEEAPPVASAPVSSAPPPPRAVPVVEQQSEPAPAPRRHTVRALGLVTGGVGLIALGMSGYFGLRASSLNDDSKNAGCDAQNRCQQSGYDKRQDAIGAATAATVTGVIGGVLVATGVTLFLVGNAQRKPSETAELSATAAASPGFSGMLVRGRF